jgi:hypothetical protein
MENNTQDIISKSKLAKSITNTKQSLTKRQLLLKLGLYEMVRIDATREEYNEIGSDVRFKTDADGNICYYRLETVVPEITDEEYDMLLPYVYAANTSSTKSRKLKIIMIIWWILTIASITILLIYASWTETLLYIIIGELFQIAFFQLFASSIYQNAKNCENLNKTLLTLAFTQLSKRKTSQDNK